MGLDRFTLGAWGLGLLVTLPLDVVGPSGLWPNTLVLLCFATARIFGYGGDEPLPLPFWRNRVLAWSVPAGLAVLRLSVG